MVEVNAEYVEPPKRNGAVTTQSLAAALPKEDPTITPAEGEILPHEAQELQSPEMLTDLYDARVLLFKAMTILSFMGIKELSGKVGDKERARMRKLASEIKPFLEETSLQWEFDDDAVVEGDQPNPNK